MKYLAHVESNLKSKIISIKDVIDGVNSNTPERWEKRTFYSLWKLTPMYAKPNSVKKAPHFAYKKGYGGNEKSGGGESIEHELSKKVISDNKFLRIKIKSLQEQLFFSQVVIEQPFNKGERKADLYVQIKNPNKFDFPVGQGLVIEIHKTNAVTKTKRQFYRNQNKAAIEIHLDKKIKYSGDLDKLYNELTKYFQEEVSATSLHDPNWKKHKLEREEKERQFQKREQEIKAEEQRKRQELYQLKEAERRARIKIEVERTDNIKRTIKKEPIKKSLFKTLWQLLLGK